MHASKPTQNTDNSITTAGGWIVQNVSSSKGGITHKTLHEERESTGNELQVTRQLRRTYDHEIVVKDIDKVAGARIKQLLRQHCVLTPLGWWTDDAGLEKLQEKVRPLAETLVDLNEAARQVGSNHRGRVGIVPLQLAPNLEHANNEIRRAVVEKLTDARDKLAAGKYHREVVLGSVRNLPRIVTGLTRTQVQLAVDALVLAVATAAKALKEGKDVATEVAAVDLGAVENAIATLALEEFAE